MTAGHLGGAANLVIAACYLVITGVMAVPLVRGRQVRANRAGTATVAIFFTCAVHHGAVGLLAVAALSGVQLAAGPFRYFCGLHPGLAATVPFPPAWSWYSVAWDTFGAAIGLYYVTLRKTYGSLMRGPVLFEDLKEQQRRALEINDDIVQGLTVAQLALETGDVEAGAVALEDTLTAAREIISCLLEDPATNARLGPGDLVRAEAAGLRPAEGRP